MPLLKKVSLIMPAYNESESIKYVLDELKKISGLDEIIVVDDGSGDNTSKIAAENGAKVIRNPYTVGYGASLKAGLRIAGGEYIIIMDSDGQHNPRYIADILKHLDEYDMVVGSRGRGSYFSLIRKPGKLLLNMFVNYIAGFKIPDINSGFRGFNKAKAMEFMSIYPNTFSFTTTISMAFYKTGYSIKYVPITTEKRRGGESSVRMVRHGISSILLIQRVIMLFNPLKVFVPVSLGLFILGLIYSLYAIIFIRFHIPTGAQLLFNSSIIIFFFGVIADQIAALRMGRK